MRPLCILVTGDPVERVRARRGGFAALVRGSAGAGANATVEWREVDARQPAPLPDASDFSGIVITGSAASVTEPVPWMLAAERLISTAVAEDVPVFGICFGHQLLAHVLGGRVGRNPRGREMGTVELEPLAADPVLAELSRPMPVQTTHVDTVLELPPGAAPLARTRLEPHAALRFSHNAWGVQFHPELDAEAMRDYIRARRDVLTAEGIDAALLEAGVRDTPAAADILRRFAEHAFTRR
jgi:GMP synthase (glutamine-hydrolysing)